MKRQNFFLCVLLGVLVACSPPRNARTAVTTPTSELPPTRQDDTPVASPSEMEILAAVSDAPIGDEEASQLMYDLLHYDPEVVSTALGRILRVDDQRFNAVFLELLRASQIGLVPAPADMFVIALERLSGESFGLDWPAWVEWYGATTFAPPPEFTTWKGEILSEIDPRFAEFLSSEHPAALRVEEVQWGGVRSDGIPALDQPAMLTAEEADYLATEEAVFGLVINGEARAYPLRIMDWHEMANDTVGGVPVSIAYCTLCGAAIAFDGRASDGNTYDFGSSGFLYRSNKLMYDRQTSTLWNQLTGEPVLGELVDTGVTLDILPIVLTTWADWQEQHPETLVLDIETGFPRVYEPGAAYADYFASTETMFPVWQRSDLLETKDQIFALRLDGVPKAYPLNVLLEQRVVNDTLGTAEVALVATDDIVTTTGQSLRSGVERQYRSGAEVRAYARDGHVFELGVEAGTLVDENGQVWQLTEEALVSDSGGTLPRLGGHLAYWFGWFAFFPNTLVYGQ